MIIQVKNHLADSINVQGSQLGHDGIDHKENEKMTDNGFHKLIPLFFNQ
jgi:hypothetical protein